MRVLAPKKAGKQASKKLESNKKKQHCKQATCKNA